MTSHSHSLTFRGRLVLAAVAGVAGSVLIAGCGIGGTATSTGTISAAAMGGKLYGGPNPISGATIKLYVTGNADGTNGGYGVAHMVQEANQVGASAGQDTGADGAFQFAGGYSCPAGQFLYVVGTGGDTGSGFNSKAALVAALGRCEDLFTAGQCTGGFIFMNERTTVATAYALGSFSAVTGTGAAAVVSIGAPDANNASVGCVANGSTCATTKAAGLRHAFLNAANLVNPFTVDGASSLPGTPLARVPLQLINSIANSLVACVNSNGTSASCTAIFASTQTATTGNIFQVAVNLAKNPTLAGSGHTTPDFFNAATPQTSFYQPTLTVAPHDYSVAIIYASTFGKTTGVQGFTYPYSAALDINDNVYIGNYNSSAKTKYNVASLTSNGTLVSFTPDNTVDPTASAAAVDSIGNLFVLGSPTGTSGTAIAR